MEKDISIYERLDELARSDMYPYHMPGHKRNPKAGLPEGFASLDITEIEHFDNLHHAQGILKDAMEAAAELYGADKTYFLVNGSTCGVLSAISSVISRGETLILGRNAHMSAYHAAYLRDGTVVSLYPELLKEYGVYGTVGIAETERLLQQNPEAKAVCITSPTYDGFISDVEQIAAVVHAYGKILIVDEAHGAHFGLDTRLPRSSMDCGADLVIHSLHKTLPSLTQTALLHVKGDRVDRERLERFLRIYQSSSPSYLLMGSIDQCIRQMRKYRREWFDSFFLLRENLIKELSTLRFLRVMHGGVEIAYGKRSVETGDAAHSHDCGGFDPLKLMIFCEQTGMSGVELQQILLEDYHLQMEMAGEYYVLAILTVMDTREGYTRLAKALKEIDAACVWKQKEGMQRGASDRFPQREESAAISDRLPQRGESAAVSDRLPQREESTAVSDRLPQRGEQTVVNDMLLQQDKFAAAVHSLREQQRAMPLARAMEESAVEAVALENTRGRIVTEFLYAYPPGISIILPGETMTEQVIRLIESYRDNGLTLQGPSDETLQTIRCVK